MTKPQKEMLLKIDPNNGRFSQGAHETLVLRALKRGGFVVEESLWNFFLTDAGHKARDSLAAPVAP
jgi:hypothetical protein